MSANHTLYRFWDAHDALLYVGVTGDAATRWKRHSRGKGWWLQVARVTVEHFTNRADLLNAEAHAIRAERPRYNVAGRGAASPPQVSTPAPRVTVPPKPAPTVDPAVEALIDALLTPGVEVPSGSYSMRRYRTTGDWSAVVTVEQPSARTDYRRRTMAVPLSDERAAELLTQSGTPWVAVERGRLA